MTPRWAIAAGFVALLVVALVIDLRARRPGSTVRPLGEVVAAALGTRAGRAVVWATWLWLGWHFLAR